MKLIRLLAIVVVVGVLLLADGWIVAKYVLGGPVRATVIDSKRGEATLRFERAPLALADYVLFASIAVAHVVALAAIRGKKRRPVAS